MRWLSVFAYSVLLCLGPTAGDVYVTKEGKECPPEGTAKSSALKTLNRLKNRNTLPKPSDIDPFVSLATLLAPGPDHSRFSEKKAATIVGYVLEVQSGGRESCNCRANSSVDKDTHIALSLAKNALEKQTVVAEVTPRLRKLMKEREESVDWSTNTLEKKLKGQWVEVTGWLMFDFVHVEEAENTAPGNPSNWRATCWEIHPVTNIKVLDSPPAEVADFQPASFAALQATHARHLENTKGREQLKKHNTELLEDLTEEERKEIEEENNARKKK
jgi:hypothetical protein